MKRKYAVLLLALAIIAGIAYMLSFQSRDAKAEIFGYVQENQTALKEFAAALIKGQMQDTAFDGRQADYYEDAEMIEFVVRASGMGSSTAYEGFYYSAQDRPIGFQGTELDFQPDGAGWKWEESGGDNMELTEQILPHWYWFRMSF